jgi:dUTP pyrophosphatase
MIVKFKKLKEEAVTPSYSKAGDAAMDLTAITKNQVMNTDFYSQDLKYLEYGTGLSIEVPENHVALIFPRSSISETDLTLTNSVGVIDSGYRGEIKFRFRATKNEIQYNVGDRVGQMLIIPYPTIELEEVKELSKTERGTGGFGSTNGKPKC